LSKVIKHAKINPLPFLMDKNLANIVLKRKEQGINFEKLEEYTQGVIGNAQAQADKISDEAREAGFNQGLEEARKLAQEYVDKTKAQMKRTIQEFESRLIELVVETAQKIIKQEITQNKDVVVNLIREALKQLLDREEVKVRVNSADLENVKNNRNNILLNVDGVKNLEIEEDGRIESGGCKIESNYGNIDAQIKSQAEEIEKAYRKVLPGAE
jgi:flagellar assembly protein FliH